MLDIERRIAELQEERAAEQEREQEERQAQIEDEAKRFGDRVAST